MKGERKEHWLVNILKETQLSSNVPHSDVNYLKATGIEVGLLLNFSESVQIKRKVYTPLED